MKHIHFIGIAGSATSSVAVMMKKKGWRVTGSDENIWDPARSLLTKNNVTWTEGYNALVIKTADLIIVGGKPIIANPKNIEYLEAKKLHKQIEPFPYLIGKYITKTNSIVVAGNYGKSTTTALLIWIFITAKKDPSFMIGAKINKIDVGVKETNSDYSIVEGDEYVAALNHDHEPKFVYYKPTHAIISSAQWDHTEYYKTKKSYIQTYLKLLAKVKARQGTIFISASGKNNDYLLTKCKSPVFIYYVAGQSQIITKEPHYKAINLQKSNKGTTFEVFFTGQSLGFFTTPLLGDFNVENCLASIAVSHNLGILVSDLAHGLKSFPGLKRRMEKLGIMQNGAWLYDDFAHSAIKAKVTVNSLKEHFPQHKLVCVYKPRQGSLNSRLELPWYEGAFDKADLVLLPRIQVKKSTPKEQRVYGKDLQEVIGKHKNHTLYIPKDEDLLSKIKELDQPQTIICLISATGWDWLSKQLLNEVT